MSDVLDCIVNRRSIREYTDQEVDNNRLYSILEAGRWAPSGLNNQPWHFILIDDQNQISRLATLTKYQQTMETSKALIAILLDENESYNKTKDIQAVGAACQNMLLAAHSLGLGAVWNGEILNKQKEAHKVLNTPKNLQLMAIICIGHPKQKQRKSERKPLTKIVHKNQYGNEL
ncbi:Nitroreductase [Methanonatronarchaeum thermophilum]|uniref:Nitroreductase n=1 Tax=Methanonatronarchaeum thermophilum TaxID=1927129 RepID=A0A1Y3GH62_9EURY|nr:nitroreductase family protein [Methanonatronarchaeum thermophilum]OUJ19534.1 Nitroreductase [Methanonatronarchaeum thermophilum]